ncbi:IS1096 element passenger TnpR family protein [Embleya sp. NPDC001921]
MTAEPEAVPRYQLKIALRDVSPPIWRRITLPADTSLGCLHEIVQVCFGWENSHLHAFAAPASGRRFVDFGVSPGGDFDHDVDEESVSVGELLPYEGGRLEYTYDFGDDWRHLITLEKSLPASTSDRRVRCTGGRRAMPQAEDTGGVWGLEAVLAAVVDGTAPVPEPWTDLVESLRSAEFDPAAFDPDALDRQLAVIEPRPPTATLASASAGARDGRRCSCGELHEDEDLDVEFAPVRPVSLAPHADLVAAARRVPLITSALRLAHWCRDGRAVTSRDVLKPALGRLAVQELDLWTLDDELSALSPADRDRRLARLRSSGDLPCLDNPWRIALYADLLEIRASTARPGAGLPAAAGDEGVLELWCESLGDELDALSDLESLGLPLVLLAELDMRSEDGDDLAAAVLRVLYEVPDGEWLDTALLVGALPDDLPKQEARLFELFLVQILEHAAGILAEFGAAELERCPGGPERDRVLLDILNAREVTEGGDDAPLPGPRLRLTPLGRHGLREYLLAQGVSAPLIGELADADASTLLDALLDYDEDAARVEIAGWIDHRGQGPAATQLIDSCAGLTADAALRRMSAAVVLAEIDGPGALGALREAAASGVPGCAQLAAITLAERGEVPESRVPELRLWWLVDHLWGPLGRADEALVEFLDRTGDMVLPLLDETADRLWRCDHPATRAVLEATGQHLRAQDKALAKRLRRSATKVGSTRRR